MLSTVHIVWTLLLVVIFIGIVFWAWSSSPKNRFHEASMLPFDDEENNAAAPHSELERNNE